MSSPGQVAFKLSFQLSPIILTGGVAANIPGGMLPIISITEAINFTTGLLSGADIDLDNCFANFHPVAGATLIDNQIGHYPFANQAVAANAIIAQPLNISMMMECSVRSSYANKLATILALQTVLSQHNNSGGTYTVATPSYLYTNCIMTGMRDVTAGASKQVQTQYQLDFEQPLVTLAQAAQVQNAMMSKLSSGVQTDGALSGVSPTVGTPPTLATPSIAPAAANTTGSGISGFSAPLAA